MAILCNITGFLYDPSGVKVTVGILYVTLQQDMISVDGFKIAPYSVSVDLSTTSGLIDINLVPTVGGTPQGLAYKVEFDPDPLDLTKPMKSKDGYWRNYWAVPNTAALALGVFASALRGEPSYNYQPIGTASSVSAFPDVITLGTVASTTNKRIKANQYPFTPEIRYNGVTEAWEFSNDGVTFFEMGSGSGSSTAMGPVTMYLGGSRDVGSISSSSISVPGWIDVVINGTTYAASTVTARVDVRTGSAGTSVTPKIYNVTDSEDAGTGDSCIATDTDFTGTNQVQAFPITLAPGVKTYRLMLDAGNNSDAVYGIGYLEFS